MRVPLVYFAKCSKSLAVGKCWANNVVGYTQQLGKDSAHFEVRSQSMRLKLLMADDDPLMHRLVDKLLASSKLGYDFEVIHCEGPKDAISAFVKNGFHAALIDLHFGANAESGFSLLQKIKKLDSELPLIVMSSQSDFSSAQKALRAGASDYLVKGFGREEFELVLSRAVQRRRAILIERGVVGDAIRGVQKIQGQHAAIQKVREQILKVAGSEVPVLIEAETGSGKELVARSLHEESGDPKLPFFAVDCGAIPQSLADSFFFGHEKGAFTGADAIRQGVFELADGGTLFLDEINSLGLDMQAKLLRVLQEREFRRIGANKVRSANFRLISASNSSLSQMVEDQKFREDLFYRINAIRIHVPALRERLSDLKILVAAFLPHRKLHGAVMNEFKKYHWPGNIRELKNILLALDVLVEKGEEISLENLPEEIRSRLQQVKQTNSKSLSLIRAQKERDEKKFLQEAYQAANRNISELARNIGMDRSYLHQKLAKLGVHKIR